MKKSFSILLIAMLSLVAMNTAEAQVKLKPSTYAWVYTGMAVDTISATDTSWTYELIVNKPTSLFYNVSAKITELTSPGKCAVSLQGKIFSDDDYTNITTYNYYGSGTDTTIVFTQNTTKQFYRYYRVKVVYGANKVKIYNIKFYFKAQ